MLLAVAQSFLDESRDESHDQKLFREEEAEVAETAGEDVYLWRSFIIVSDPGPR